MSRAFRTYFLVTGVAGALAILFPQIVLILLFAGGIPGIILGLAPSVFLYSALWWCVRWLLLRVATQINLSGRSLEIGLGILAAAIVAIPAVTLPPLLNAPFEKQADALRADDLANDGPLVFPQVVAVVMPNSYGNELYCEEICARLLYNGVASRVIVGEATPPGRTSQLKPLAYWIERRDSCPKPALTRMDIFWPVDFPIKRGEDPKSRVLARVAAGECLVSERGLLEDAALTITYRPLRKGESMLERSWSLTLDTLAAHQLEVTDANGKILFRRTEVKFEPLVTPLYVSTAAGLLTTVTYAGWARSTKELSPLGPHGRDVLPALLGAAARPPNMPDTP